MNRVSVLTKSLTKCYTVCLDWGVAMATYRIYVLSPANRIQGPAQIVECPDDQAALEQATQLIDGLDLEVWQGTRLVVRLARTHRGGHQKSAEKQ